MTVPDQAALFRATHELLGHTPEDVARRYDIDVRSMRRMLGGKKPIPAPVIADTLAELDELTAAVRDLVDGAGRDGGDAEVTLVTYASEDDFRAAHPDSSHGVVWHRRVTVLGWLQLRARGREATIRYAGA